MRRRKGRQAGIATNQASKQGCERSSKEGSKANKQASKEERQAGKQAPICRDGRACGSRSQRPGRRRRSPAGHNRGGPDLLRAVRSGSHGSVLRGPGVPVLGVRRQRAQRQFPGSQAPADGAVPGVCAGDGAGGHRGPAQARIRLLRGLPAAGMRPAATAGLRVR